MIFVYMAGDLGAYKKDKSALLEEARSLRAEC